MKIENGVLIIFFMILILSITTTAIKAEALTENDLIGKWTGKIRVNNQELEIIIDFFSTGQGIKGTIDIPAQNIEDYQLKNINYKENKINFEIPAEETGKFTGKFSDFEIVGDYNQNNFQGKFHLIKEIENKEKTKEKVDKNEVNTAANKIEEQLEGDPPYPVLVIFSDFGKADDKTIKIYQMIKELYIDNGFAVFYYKNDSFNFTENIRKDNFRYNDLVKNAINFVEKISINPNYSNIHILGEGQGALLSLAAVEEAKIDVKSFVFIEPPTGPASEIILDQLSGLQNDLFAETRYIINKLKKGEKTKDISEELKTFFAPEIQPFLISWFEYNPVELINNSKKSILIIEKGIEKMPQSIIKRDNIKYLLIEKKIFIKEEKTESMYLNEEFRKQIEDFINM